jgi:hypothetical protein
MTRTSGNVRLSLSVMAVTAFAAMPVAVVAAPSSYASGRFDITPGGVWSNAFEWARLQEKIAAWADLSADWDGEQGVVPSAAVLASASRFVDTLQVEGIREPAADLAGDGEISFHWRTGDDLGTVSFLSDGHLVAYIRRGDEEPFRVDRPCSDVAMRELFDRLVRIA